MFAVAVTLVFFAVFGPSQAALSDEYQNNERLDAENASDYMLYWTYNKADSTISFAAKAKTIGWVGLGFTTKIDNTTTYDVVRGSYEEFGDKKTELIDDFHAVGKETPVKDTQQNLMNTSVTENNTFTTIKFKRALDTKDANDAVIQPGPMIVVWSFGNSDQLGTSPAKMGYKTVTFIPEDPGQKNVSTTTLPKTSGPVSKAVICQDSWLLLTLSALLFMVPVLRP